RLILFRTDRKLRIRRHRFEVIEIEKHRWRFGSSDEQILEIAESILSQDVAFVARDKPSNSRLSRKNIEVVLPKIDHHFLQLTLGIDSPHHAVRNDLGHYLARRL